MLGGVDKADPLPDCGELDEAEEAACGVVVAGGHASTVLETVEEALNAVSQGVERPVDRVLNEAVLLGRYLWLAASAADVLADGVAVVAAIGQQHLGVDVMFGHQVGVGGAVVGFAGRQ